MSDDPDYIDPLPPEDLPEGDSIDDPPTELPSPMPESEDIDALKTVISAGFTLVQTAIKVGKDGLDLSDARHLITDGELRSAIRDVVEKADELDDELLDLSPREVLALVRHVTGEVDRLITGE